MQPLVFIRLFIYRYLFSMRSWETTSTAVASTKVTTCVFGNAIYILND